MKYQKIKTFADACKALKLKSSALPEVKTLPEKHQKQFVRNARMNWKRKWKVKITIKEKQ